MTTCQDLRTQIFVTPAAVCGSESRPHTDSAMELEYDGMDAIFHGRLRSHTDTGMALHHAGSAAAGQNLGDNQNQMLLTLELAWTRMELLLLLLVVDDRIMTYYGLSPGLLMMLMWTWITVELLLLLLDDNQMMLQLNLAWTRMACRWRERFCNWLHRIRKWGRDCPRGSCGIMFH